MLFFSFYAKLSVVMLYTQFGCALLYNVQHDGLWKLLEAGCLPKMNVMQLVRISTRIKHATNIHALYCWEMFKVLLE